MRTERGIALVTALLIVAIAVAAVVPWSTNERVAVARVANNVDWTQARLVGRGLERWAEQILIADGAAGSVDHLAEAWATPVPGISAGRGAASGALVDAQGRFNLNNLIVDGGPDLLARLRLERLLSILGLDPQLTDAVIDWIDADDIVQGTRGAEVAVYAGASPPYRPANAPFVSPSELRLVSGFDAESVALLLPYVSALPGRTDVNVNTAPAEVLQALVGNTSASVAQNFIATRQREPLTGTDQLVETSLFSGSVVELDGLSVASRWFKLEARVTLPRATLVHHALIFRAEESAATQRRWTTP
ncbi:MAG: type II secretion system minor pseudopilin GspK [Chromatiales bacterium]|jgi:general secretion pathway protein K|nr:type II secretion system minor pseudopilin GspK [Chromatiales bacterium]